MGLGSRAEPPRSAGWATVTRTLDAGTRSSIDRLPWTSRSLNRVRVTPGAETLTRRVEAKRRPWGRRSATVWIAGAPRPAATVNVSLGRPIPRPLITAPETVGGPPIVQSNTLLEMAPANVQLLRDLAFTGVELFKVAQQLH